MELSVRIHVEDVLARMLGQAQEEDSAPDPGSVALAGAFGSLKQIAVDPETAGGFLEPEGELPVEGVAVKRCNAHVATLSVACFRQESRKATSTNQDVARAALASRKRQIKDRERIPQGDRQTNVNRPIWDGRPVAVLDRTRSLRDGVEG